MNSAATGAPTITGTAQVGKTLTAATTEISDDDGITDAVFAYQWLADDAAIASATASTYTVVAADEGKALKVRVTFTDDADNAESLTSAATAAAKAANTPATGAPAIDGSPIVGQTLTATTSAIGDDDGITDAVFAYQWLADDATIDSATAATYTVVAADVGKAFTVTVTFTDDADNAESLTSTATAAAKPANTPATGAPGIDGSPVVGQTLTATTSAIGDDNGITNATFAYQWLADDATIDSATASTYTVVAADVGKAFTVTVTFTDDADNAESLTSQATAAVTQPLTAGIHAAPDSHDGQSVFTFELRFSEAPKTSFSYVTIRDHAFTVTGGAVSGVRRLEPNKNVRWEISVRPSGNADVTVALPVTTDCASQGAICTQDGRMLSSALELITSGPPSQQSSDTAQPGSDDDAQANPLTATIHAVPESHDGQSVFTFELRFSETPKTSFSYITLRDHAFMVTDGEVVKARRLQPGNNIGWEISVMPDSSADVTIVLPVTTDCGAQGAVCTEDGRMLSGRLELTVSGPSG